MTWKRAVNHYLSDEETAALVNHIAKEIQKRTVLFSAVGFFFGWVAGCVFTYFQFH